MDDTVASREKFGITDSASEDYVGSAVGELADDAFAVGGQVDVPRAFVDVQVEAAYPKGVDAKFRRVEVLPFNSTNGVGANKVADGGVVDLAQLVVIHGQVDAVVVTPDPIEGVVVPDEERVARKLGDDIVNQVFRTGELHPRLLALYQPDIDVVIYADSRKIVRHGSAFGDGFPVGKHDFAARGQHQANEGKQDCGEVSFHGAGDSICVGNGILCRR